MNGLDRHLDGRQGRLVHEVPRLSCSVAPGTAPRRGAVRHNRCPNLPLGHLCTAVHSPDLVVVVQLREARASKAAVLRHEDDNRARRRDTDDVAGCTRLSDSGTHSSPTRAVPQTTERKTTMITSVTGPITCGGRKTNCGTRSVWLVLGRCRIQFNRENVRKGFGGKNNLERDIPLTPRVVTLPTNLERSHSRRTPAHRLSDPSLQKERRE